MWKTHLLLTTQNYPYYVNQTNKHSFHTVLMLYIHQQKKIDPLQDMSPTVMQLIKNEFDYQKASQICFE